MVWQRMALATCMWLTLTTTPFACFQERGWQAALLVILGMLMLQPAPVPRSTSRMQCVLMRLAGCCMWLRN